ncbi:MAG: hypothetical protein EOO25_18015 [Comamonadaceae bacterium]|nr:MAG: hypothetical protein EOO25_18015 [Comamonadaceae bacterium]
MTVPERISRLVDERLGGDRARLCELFGTREVFDQLRATGDAADWYRFQPATFDGEYLVELSAAQGGGFEVYQQERGLRSGVRRFRTLAEAARALFA